ncbi:SPOSA6832_03423, partial [Sporobolomyces salmonicolor]
MDHGGMDHGGHGGHMPDSSHSMPCKMSMLWNTDPMGVCLVFPSLQITGQASLVGYLLFIAGISILCEYLRLILASFDRQLRSQLRGGAFNPPSASTSAASGTGTSPRLGMGLGVGTPGGRRVTGFGDGSDEALLAGRGRFWAVMRVLSVAASSLKDRRRVKLIRLGQFRRDDRLLPWSLQMRRSLGYVAHVALTFYIMLLVMSYNAQIISAILIGAFVGHLTFQRNFDLGVGATDEDGKGLACH